MYVTRKNIKGNLSKSSYTFMSFRLIIKLMILGDTCAKYNITLDRNGKHKVNSYEMSFDSVPKILVTVKQNILLLGRVV